MRRLATTARGLCARYREQVSYLFFGALATVVSIGSFAVAERVFGLPTLVANVVSWVLAVAFAYVTNRTWVFKSKARGAVGVAREAATFVGGRVLTLGLEELILLVGVEWLDIDSLVVKVVAQVAVVVTNYLISKLVVFRAR